MPIFLNYPFWLAAVSLFCFTLERFFPWRRQKALRDLFWQDMFWLIFNGHYLGLLLAMAAKRLIPLVAHNFAALGLPSAQEAHLLLHFPPAVQFIVVLLAKDSLEWGIHNLLHRVPFLWEFHKLHHSIETLDWIGNMRFHAIEIMIYKSILYIPLGILGANDNVILAIAVFYTLMGHLNHANLAISWGPLKYVLNSPKMHVWHHDKVMHHKAGQNFGLVLSVWDWIFGTAYMPEGQPKELGFFEMDRYPRRLLARFVYPLGSRGHQT